MATPANDLPSLRAPIPLNERQPPRWPPPSYYAKVTAVIVLVFGGLFLAYQVRAILLSLFLGLFLAVGFEPLVRWLVRHGVRRGLAVLILIVAFLALSAAIGYILLEPAVEQAGELIKALPSFATSAIDRLQSWGITIDATSISTMAQDLAKELPKLLSASVGSVGAVLGAVGTAVFRVFTVIALSIYFMLALPRLRASLAHMLGTRERALVAEAALQKVGGYVSGQLTLCLLAGVVTTLVLTLLQVPYSAIIGLIVALLDAVPQVGATIAAVIGTAIALSNSWQSALLTLLTILAYQQLENYVISPRIFAQAVNLSPLAVFVAVLIGGGLAGAVGALVALPVAAATKVVLAYALRHRRRDRERSLREGAGAGTAASVDRSDGARPETP